MFYVKMSTSMTDKTDRLLEVLAHPENFSDAALSEVLRDPEMQQLYRLLSHTADALTETPEIDIDTEW